MLHNICANRTFTANCMHNTHWSHTSYLARSSTAEHPSVPESIWIRNQQMVTVIIVKCIANACVQRMQIQIDVSTVKCTSNACVHNASWNHKQSSISLFEPCRQAFAKHVGWWRAMCVHNTLKRQCINPNGMSVYGVCCSVVAMPLCITAVTQ